MKHIHENIVNNIISHRKRLNLSQEQLAEKAGVKKFTTVSNWERGANLPNTETLFKLCEIFGITMDEMYGVNTPVVTESRAAAENIRKHYGEQAVHLIMMFAAMNDRGQKKVVDYTADLIVNPMYADKEKLAGIERRVQRK
ncbi:MAG: helix-turn-helix domain-containing protein [Chitinispirillales bacterium]|jgi:transcriptional regulator with XRE-family HTH domain|nr:helix-turn-helix domain-containing protein [Chitinispirillales bacterium]